MQNELLVHMAFSIQKTGQFHHTIYLKLGYSQSQLIHCNRENIKNYLPHYPRFCLPRYMINGEFDYGNTGWRITQNAQLYEFPTNNCLITSQLQLNLRRCAGFVRYIFSLQLINR